VSGGQTCTYGDLNRQVRGLAAGLISLGLARGERVAVFLEKRTEMVVACFGAAAAGCVFVPINPILKPLQIGHILRAGGARVLITSPQRLPALLPPLAECPELHHVVLTDDPQGADVPPGVALHG